MYNIRLTRESDLQSILELVHEFHEESLKEYELVCNNKIADALMPKLVDTSMVMTYNEEIVGVIAGFVTNHIVDNEKLFQEVIWYVTKEHRHHGVDLLEEMESHCKLIGIKHIVMVNMGNLRDKVFKRFYESQGYKLLETQYIKKL